MRIALFSTCIGDSLFPDAHKATALILSRLGYDVVFPEEQTCCGQMHINTGYQEQTLGMIRLCGSLHRLRGLRLRLLRGRRA